MKIITHHAFYPIVANNKTLFKTWLSEVDTLSQLINKIDSLSKKCSDYGYTISPQYATTQEAQNKFKGDLFEIFTEAFIKVNAFGNELDISDYTNTTKDFEGVDATGTVQGNNVAVQIKFLSDPRNNVSFDAMRDFHTVATSVLDVENNKSRLILFTTSYLGIDYSKMNNLYRNILEKNIRIFGYDKISYFIDNNIDVWNRINTIFDETINYLPEPKVKADKAKVVQDKIDGLIDLPAIDSPYKSYTINKKLTTKKDADGTYITEIGKEVYNVSQKECFEKMQSTNKLSIILPTGTGKGHLIFVDLLTRIHNKNGNVFAICSHRIGLNKQHTMDMFENFKDFIGEIGYIFVASENYTQAEKQRNEYISLLGNVNLDNLITTLKPGQSIQEVIDYHKNEGRTVIIVSTYHSLQKLYNVEIDVMYCDEADKMVNNKPKTENGIKQEPFMKKFLKLRNNVKNQYFLTATPKDWSKEWTTENIEFMNNKDIFGERIEMEFSAAVKSGYIVQPYIHIVYPVQQDVEDTNIPDEEDLEDETFSDIVVKDMNVNLKAKIKMIAEAFVTHKQFLKERSSQPEKIGAKMLVKCKNIRSEMWGIFHEGLREALPNTKIFAGGSYGYRDTDNQEYKDNNHYIYNPYSEIPLQSIQDRDTYLAKIKELTLDEDAIVLHCDILSEGINVKGFTNVMFVGGVTQTDAKAMQNIGRATRVVDEDRYNLNNGTISLTNSKGWIKPFCTVTIPFWNAESSEAKDKMVELIKSLRNIGFGIERFGTGTDINKDDKLNPELEPQNENKLAKRKSGIKALEQELEELSNNEKLINLHPVNYLMEMVKYDR